MGKKQTADGRWIIGGGENSTDYKGFLHWRECYICLTESGATEESVDYLNALKDYALAHYALGEPIMPPSMTVWVVANGKATAVQADDVKVEDGDYTICGITYSDGAWDYSNAGQGQGGGSSLPEVTAEDNGDLLGVVNGEWGKMDAPYTVEDKTANIIPAQTAIAEMPEGYPFATALLTAGEDAPDAVAAAAKGREVKATVTVDNVEYTDVPGFFFFGALGFGVIDTTTGLPDFSTYPFTLMVGPQTGAYFETAGEHTIVAVCVYTDVVPTEAFGTAVKEIVPDSALPLVVHVTMRAGAHLGYGNDIFENPTATPTEINEAVLHGRPVILIPLYNEADNVHNISGPCAYLSWAGTQFAKFVGVDTFSIAYLGDVVCYTINDDGTVDYEAIRLNAGS